MLVECDISVADAIEISPQKLPSWLMSSWSLILVRRLQGLMGFVSKVAG